jgi:pyridoxamine 5'-phosphate oxidase
MDKTEILSFITKHSTAYLATASGGTPHVRAMGTYRADDKGIIFAMQSDKDVYRQLTANPEVEICYFAEGVQVRVAGKLVEDKSQALKEEVTEKRTFYKPGVEKNGWGYVGVFRMTGGKATVHDMKAPPSPSGKVWINL